MLVSLLGAFRCGICLLVIGVANPIHSILLLIRAFFSGTLLLFLVGREYFALLFLIVYVGAIVVLFLFIIRRLERKRVSAAIRFRDLFALRHLVLGLFALEVLLLVHSSLFDLSAFVDGTTGSIGLIESNGVDSLARWLSHGDSFRALGGLLYTTAAVPLLLAATLLFLARVGGIVIALESHLASPSLTSSLDGSALRGVKTEVPEAQALRHPALTVARSLSFFCSFFLFFLILFVILWVDTYLVDSKIKDVKDTVVKNVV